MLNGHSPFHIAAGCQRSDRFINLMLKYDGNPNVRNAEGLTPLHIATSWGKINSMKLLIQNGADIHVQDEEGRDLKEFAELHGSQDCVNYAESLLSNAVLSHTPKSSKLSAVIHLSETYKENRNPNSPHNREVFNFRSPLNDACDDSWIVKNRGGSARRQRKNATLTLSPTSFPKGFEPISYDSSDKKENRLPDDLTTTESMHPAPLGLVYSPVPRCAVAHSPRMQTHLHSKSPVDDDLDTTDKCVGTSTLHVSPNLPEQPYLNSTDKCIGTSTLTILPGHVDSDLAAHAIETSVNAISLDNQDPDNTDKCIGTSLTVLDDHAHNEKRVESQLTEYASTQTIEPSNQGLCKSNDATTSENGKTDATMNPNPIPTSMMNEQIHGGGCDLQNKRLEDSSTCHMIPWDFDSTQTLPVPSVEVSSGNQNELENDDISSHARNMLLSTKVPLAKSDVAVFFGENFVNIAKKVIDSSNSNEHRTLNLMKFSKPHDANYVSTSKPSPMQNMSSNTNESKHEKVQRSTHPFAVPANLDSKHTDIVSSLPPGKSPQDHSKHSRAMGNIHSFTSPTHSNTVVNNLSELLGQVSPSSPVEERHSKLNIRQFSAMSISERGTSTGVTAPVKQRERFHSTVLHQSYSDPDFSEDITWDISVIKADNSYVLHPVEAQQLERAASESSFAKPSATEPPNSQIDMSGDATIIYNWKSYWEGEPIPESAKSKRKRQKTPNKKCITKGTEPVPVMADLERLTDVEIREKLVAFGETPGPILAYRDMYLKKLGSLLMAQEQGTLQQCDNASPMRQDSGQPKFSPVLEKCLRGQPLPDTTIDDDDIVRQQFEQPDPNLSWREGTAKSSFTYLLLDPRVTNELPIRAKYLTHIETFKAFVGAIFYIGKGKESRPFQHFSEALQAKQKPSHKVQHIRSIWDAGLGVVALHVYQNTIACEAYTREAAMIDAVGLAHLTNCKRGEYYGEASRWVLRRKREYGSFLLEKALNVLMVEGERQIKPSNLESRKKKRCNPVSA